ncbi:anti-sigma factor family protein [Microvirga sp. GCM10011540]|uniref:anti-sigma factor family protein n=1 Tax=Microvirga sp. GCM10011540 TaxID=3317338 RepID=UPI003613AA52
MSQLHLSDEILMAFADGELDPPMAAAVEQAMLTDPTVTKRVADFLRSRSLTRSALLREEALEVPAELQAAVEARIKEYETREAGPGALETSKGASAAPGRRWRLGGLALAAGLAALAVAGAGYLAGRQDAPPPAGGLMAQLESPSVRDALSRTPSGQEAEVAAGRVRIISTYRLADGSVCREFRLHSTLGTADALACRGAGWTVNFALAGPGTDSGYQPSGATDLIDAHLQNLGAGEPLLDSAEVQALEGAPRPPASP